jgi:hypothetical protein
MDDRRSEMLTVTVLTSCTSSTYGVIGFYPFSETLSGRFNRLGDPPKNNVVRLSSFELPAL